MSNVLCIFVALVLVVLEAESSNLRGVQDAVRVKFESVGDTFACFDGRKSIPSAFVNDDYCDCDDGSDEPGTAACSTILQVPSSWKFQCSSELFRKEILHSRVNDRICDCCDGSDEFTSGVSCPNVCAEAAEREGREFREREERRVAGVKAREQLTTTAKSRRTEMKKQLEAETESLSSLEQSLKTAEAAKVAAEAIERQERDEIKRKSEAEFEVWNAEKAAREKEAPPPQNAEPPATTSIVCSKWRQTKDCRGDGERQIDQDKDCSLAIPDGWSGYCECVDSQNGEEILHRFDCGHKKLTCDFVCSHDGDEPSSIEEPAVAEETFKVNDGSSHETDAARDARKQFTDINSKKIASENKIKDLEKDLSRDFGPDDAFLPLNGECFELEEREYTYKLCPFSDIQQLRKGAGHGPVMGRFKGFGEQSYSLWGSKSDYSHMIFADGESCWGGPARSTDVHIVCGATSKVLRVEEPSMCTYKMVFETPAVCE